jgi:DNA-binding response OmpR family regulator
VLVVEDDRAARRAICLILARQGFAVSETDTVAGALRGLELHPDWVLLDLMLPDGCGTEVLRRAGATGASSKMCVITGCASEKLDEARALGPQFVFKKPVDVERLLAAMTA